MSQTTRPEKELVLRALSSYRGDDLERAEAAFRNCTAAQMHEGYGQSGRTREEILDGYRQHRAEVDAAIAWVKSV